MWITELIQSEEDDYNFKFTTEIYKERELYFESGLLNILIFKSYFTLTTIWAFFFLCPPIHCRSVESDLPLTHSEGMNNRCFEFSHRKWNTIATTLSLLQICFKHYILYCRQRPTPENITKLMLTYDQGTIQWQVSLKNWWGCLM